MYDTLLPYDMYSIFHNLYSDELDHDCPVLAAISYTLIDTRGKALEKRVWI